MTRIFTCLLIGLMLTVSSCSDKNSVPSGVLRHDKMEAVMWDVIQSEQYSAAYLAKDSAHIHLKQENLRLYDEVFRLHQVSREEFRKSYLYYMSRADLAQVLFDSLLAKGNRLRTESYSRSFRPVTTPPPPARTTSPAAVPVKPLVSSPAAAPVKPPLTTRFSAPVKNPAFPNRRRDSANMHTKKPS